MAASGRHVEPGLAEVPAKAALVTAVLSLQGFSGSLHGIGQLRPGSSCISQLQESAAQLPARPCSPHWF